MNPQVKTTQVENNVVAGTTPIGIASSYEQPASPTLAYLYNVLTSLIEEKGEPSDEFARYCAIAITDTEKLIAFYEKYIFHYKAKG